MKDSIRTKTELLRDLTDEVNENSWLRIENAKLNIKLNLVQEIIKKHGCSSPKDCGLHFLDEQLKKKFKDSKLVREDSETFVVK